jgi:hypothetical protein
MSNIIIYLILEFDIYNTTWREQALKEKKSCSNCINGTAISVNSDILCRYKGAVSPDFVCSKHRSMPTSKAIKDKDFKCVDCDNFVFEFDKGQDTSSVGICKLFTVRPYDGTQRNACSKFAKRSELEVS